MGFTKINVLSITELFVQQIENMILSGELSVGEQLPPARELAVRMGVSRAVVSAGLVELEKLGFVEVKAPGEKPRPLQAYRHRQLRRLGCKVYVLDGTEQIEGILDRIEGGDAT